jgi:hypothetical protein
MEEDPEVLATVCAIARYVSANPLASDTPEGIYRWWLMDHCSIDTLLRALTCMKEQGVMEEQVALDGRSRYRRGAKDAELERLLQDCAGASALRH